MSSGTRQKTTKPVTSYYKSSKFPALKKADNEETPLKQPHQDAFTPKQENLERTKRLHRKCGFVDTERSFILTFIWLKYHEVMDINVEIAQNLYNVYYTLICFC